MNCVHPFEGAPKFPDGQGVSTGQRWKIDGKEVKMDMGRKEGKRNSRELERKKIKAKEAGEMCILHIVEHFLLCYEVEKRTFTALAVFRWSVCCNKKAQKKVFSL